MDIYYRWLIKLEILSGFVYEDVLIRFEILKAIWDAPSKTDFIHI